MVSPERGHNIDPPNMPKANDKSTVWPRVRKSHALNLVAIEAIFTEANISIAFIYFI